MKTLLLLKKWLKNLLFASIAVISYSWLLYYAIQYAYKDFPFDIRDRLVDIKYHQLPNSFFKEIAHYNFGYAHRLISLAKDGKCGLKRIGEAVLLIDQLRSIAFLTGPNLDKSTIKIIGSYCNEKDISIFCNKKYNKDLASVLSVQDPNFLLDNQIVFECKKTYEIGVNLGLQGLMNASVEPISKKDYPNLSKKEIISYLYNSGQSNTLHGDAEGYTLKVTNNVLKNNILAEAYIITGRKSEWSNINREFLRFFKDNRSAEIWVFLEDNRHIDCGLEKAMIQKLINIQKEKYPYRKIYLILPEDACEIAKELELEKVDILNHFRYHSNSSDNMMHNMLI